MTGKMRGGYQRSAWGHRPPASWHIAAQSLYPEAGDSPGARENALSSS